MIDYQALTQTNLILGARTACGVIISCVLTKFVPLYPNVFLNRASEVGSYNIIQDDYYSEISQSSWQGLSDNFYYRGIFQSVKWLPNLHIQNKAKEIFVNNTHKAFLIPVSGMTPFFTIGAIEAIICKTESQKLLFTSVSVSILVALPYINNRVITEKTETGGVYLSCADTINAQIGLIGSFFIMDLAHQYGISKKISHYINLPTLTTLAIASNEAYNFWTDENYTIDKSIQNISNEMMRIAAFSVAKAVAVVGVTIAYNNPVAALAVSGLVAYEVGSVYYDVMYEEKDIYESTYEAVGETLSVMTAFLFS